ncbi:hypothetical protein BN130_690 [Cronobacter malonaticus 507]|nr:hypothetical protein BN130_690 [Cronobacter malonaticus 507]
MPGVALAIRRQTASGVAVAEPETILILAQHAACAIIAPGEPPPRVFAQRQAAGVVIMVAGGQGVACALFTHAARGVVTVAHVASQRIEAAYQPVAFIPLVARRLSPVVGFRLHAAQRVARQRPAFAVLVDNDEQAVFRIVFIARLRAVRRAAGGDHPRGVIVKARFPARFIGIAHRLIFAVVFDADLLAAWRLHRDKPVFPVPEIAGHAAAGVTFVEKIAARGMAQPGYSRTGFLNDRKKPVMVIVVARKPAARHVGFAQLPERIVNVMRRNACRVSPFGEVARRVIRRDPLRPAFIRDAQGMAIVVKSGAHHAAAG